MDDDATGAGTVRFRNPATVAPPLGHYSHVAVVPAGARLLVLAGQTGHAADGQLPESPEAQFRNALTNILAILASEGAGPGDIGV